MFVQDIVSLPMIRYLQRFLPQAVMFEAIISFYKIATTVSHFIL